MILYDEIGKIRWMARYSYLSAVINLHANNHRLSRPPRIDGGIPRASVGEKAPHSKWFTRLNPLRLSVGSNVDPESSRDKSVDCRVRISARREWRRTGRISILMLGISISKQVLMYDRGRYACGIIYFGNVWEMDCHKITLGETRMRIN